MGTGCSSQTGISIGDTGEVPCFKIVLVGDPEVGKSSIFLRYFKNQFDYSYRPTNAVTIENVVKKLNIPEHTIASISIWDLPGREEVDLRQSYYRDVDAAIVVVNVSDPESIELAGTWRQDILNHAVVTTKRVVQTPEGPRIVVDYEKADPAQIPVLLLGNKFDIVEEKLAILNQPVDDESVEPESPADDDQQVEDSMISVQGINRSISSEPKEDNINMEMGDTRSTMGQVDQEVPQSEGVREVTENGHGGDDPRREGEVWKYEEKQAKEEKPAEISHLEACCEQHGFVGRHNYPVPPHHLPPENLPAFQLGNMVDVLYLKGTINFFCAHPLKKRSVAVSAKESDGGVHVAIQALVRHLLEHRLRHRALQKMAMFHVRRSKQRRGRPPKVRPDAFRPLEATQVPELDQLFSKFDPPLSLVHEASLAYQRALQHFKCQCIQMELVEGPKCSIEDCIEGISGVLKNDDLELVIQENDGFIELAVKGDEQEEEDKNEEMKELLMAFNTQISVACSVIVGEFPILEKNLEELNVNIVEHCSELIDQHIRSHGSLTSRDQQQIKDTTELNIARVKHATIQCTEGMRDVETLKQKINAAAMW